MTDYYRHSDGEDWYRMSRVQKRREISTPWGPAMAEVGTLVMTLKSDPKHKIICTQADLKNHWTTDSIPDTSEPDPPIMLQAFADPNLRLLPGGSIDAA